MQDGYPWDRDPDETDRNWELFSAYLKLEKRGANPRRYETDLAAQLGCTISNVNQVARRFDWENRAAAWDAYLLKPVAIAELTAKREFATELREDGREFRQLAKKTIRHLIELGKFDAPAAIRLYNLTLDMEEVAEKIEAPHAEDEEDQVNKQINELLAQLTRGVGKMAPGTPGGVVTATERTVSFEVGGESGERSGQPVVEVRALPREVRSGRTGSGPDD